MLSVSNSLLTHPNLEFIYNLIAEKINKFIPGKQERGSLKNQQREKGLNLITRWEVNIWDYTYIFYSQISLIDCIILM